MSQIKYHQMLVKAADFDTASTYVSNFFDKTMLLNYDLVEIKQSKSCQAFAPEFWADLNSGIVENRRILVDLVDELKESGLKSAADIVTVSHGYQSKIFHIIAHLLDGFIGIDTQFYNLLEDSHWLSKNLKEQIKANPLDYWLLHVEVSFEEEAAASLIHT